MNGEPSALGEGDASDLAWLDMRADVTARQYAVAMAGFREYRDLLSAALDNGEQVPTLDVAAVADRVNTSLDAAIAAKTARDDAYTAQETLLPPPTPSFDSAEERRAWLDLMRDEWIDALRRRDAAMAELESLPQLVPLPDDMTSEQAAAIFDADEPYADRRIELILAAEAAQKDLQRAGAALASGETEDD